MHTPQDTFWDTDRYSFYTARFIPTIAYVVIKTLASSIFLGFVFFHLLENTIILFESNVVHFVS